MSYFVHRPAAERTAQMVSTADSVEWIAVRNEVEALFLEFNLIKKHRPRFNIRLKDDKSYPYLAITLDEEWPRAMVMRGAKRKGVRYFGPYAHAYAIRETLDLLLRTFPIRTCTKNKFDRHAPSRAAVPLRPHREVRGAVRRRGRRTRSTWRSSQELIDFLDGETSPILDRLDKQMHEASDELEFERAARLRDQIVSVRKAIERQQMVDAKEEDYDLIGMVDDPLEASVQVFLVRKGRVVGRKGLVVDKVEDVESARARRPPPRAALRRPRALRHPARDPRARGARRSRALPGVPRPAARGARCGCACPQRGAKRQLHGHGHAERARGDGRATSSSARPTTTPVPGRWSRCRTRSGSPRRRCASSATTSRTSRAPRSSASMVVMEDGLPKRSDYRRFKMKYTPDGQDDFASMEEVLTRRFRRYLQDRDEGARSGKRFAYPPNLVLIDGGKGQLGVAVRVLEEMGLEDIAVASLAKRFEEVYVPGQSDPVRIPRDSEALYLLQQVRDEAHRFAITYHRQLRGKSMTKSVLDDVPGLGPTRRARLLKEHGSVKRLRALTEEELVAIPWLPEKVGRAVFAQLHGENGAA